MSESINHFQCVVAKAIWKYVSDFLGYDIGIDYISGCF
jgi:hypothetical protein